MTKTFCLKGCARFGIVALLFLLSLLAAPPPLHAISFNFNFDHCDGGGGCGAAPFGTVTLTQNGTNVDVTVHLNSGNQFVKTGSVDKLAFKFNATGVVLSDITVNQTVAGQTLAAQTGTFTGAGMGSFSFGIACTTCGGGASTAFGNDIVFHVANATIADLTAANTSGFVFVADVIGTTGNTGPVASTGPISTPEPASILLLGFGIAGLGAAMRRLRRPT